jgi:hypothetical protein
MDNNPIRQYRTGRGNDVRIRYIGNCEYSVEVNHLTIFVTSNQDEAVTAYHNAIKVT